jgi:uncharacterized protein YkwD
MLLSRFSTQARLRRFAYVLLLLLLCVQGACTGNTAAGSDASAGANSAAFKGRQPPASDCPSDDPGSDDPGSDDPGPDGPSSDPSSGDPNSDPNRRPAPPPGQGGGVVQEQLALINGDRASLGLAPLTLDADLSKAAAAHNDEMIAAQDLTHDTKYGSFDDRLRAFGAKFSAAGENLAWGSGGLTPDEANEMLFTDEAPSPANNNQAGGHYENIVGDYERVGIAYAEGYWTMEFAK